MTEREGKDTLVQTSHIILTNLKPKSNKTKLIAVKKKKGQIQKDHTIMY